MWCWEGEKNPFSRVLLHAESVKWQQAPQVRRCEASLGSTANRTTPQRAASPGSLPAHPGAVSHAALLRAQMSIPACAGLCFMHRHKPAHVRLLLGQAGLS